MFPDKSVPVGITTPDSLRKATFDWKKRKPALLKYFQTYCQTLHQILIIKTASQCLMKYIAKKSVAFNQHEFGFSLNIFGI